MSKTAQRKKSYYDLGRYDFYLYRRSFANFYGRQYQSAYMRGFNLAKNNYDLKHCKTLLQWFRIRFCMVTA